MRVRDLMNVMDKRLTVEIIQSCSTIFLGEVRDIPDNTIQDLLVVEINPVGTGNSTIQEIYTTKASLL